MAIGIDDTLFGARVRGDDAALDEIWQATFRAAHAYARLLLDGNAVRIAGLTPEDLVRDAAWRLARAVASGRVKNPNVSAHVLSAVYTTSVSITQEVRE